MISRQYTPIDRLLINLDQAVRTVFGHPPVTDRTNPAAVAADSEITSAERARSVRLMRVNHTGEICAQALYQGQALTCRNKHVRECLEQAAAEENDHLDWCKTRVKELGGHTSVLNPLFYGGSFLIGVVNGKIGDRWNLGFVIETEHQVVQHLEDHLHRLPPEDLKSRAILETMQEDERHHATMALQAGGIPLPLPARGLMKAVSKVMTKTTYWI
jgi:ubiquinone biosynthesis monooxygenase Coq7